MLTAMSVINAQGTTFAFPFDNVDNGYSIQEITGLDPVKATIVTSSFATQDGEQYESAKRGSRNIVIKMGYEPDYGTSSVRALRKQLYAYFSPKAFIELIFSSDDLPDVHIAGTVESIDTPQFAQEQVATISVICVNPDFYDPNTVSFSGNTDQAPVTQRIDGDVETGFVLRMNPTGPLSSFEIVSTSPFTGTRTMDIALPLIAGDILTLSTVPGNKGLTLSRSGSNSSVLYALSPYSDWMKLYPGSNAFSITAGGVGIPYSVEYTNKYGGL